MEKTVNKTVLTWGLLILLSIFWGTSFLLMKKALLVFEPLQVGSLRIFIAGLTLMPIALMNIKKMPREKLPYIFTSGLLGYLIPALLFSIAGSKLSSSLSGALNSVTPLFVLIIGVMFFSQKIKTLQVIGLLVALVGSLLLIFSGGKGISFDNPYSLLIFAATICYGVNVNIMGKHFNGINSIHLAAWTLGTVTIISGLIALFTGVLNTIHHPDFWLAFGELFLLGAVNSAMMSILFNRLMQLSSPVFASSVTYLIPIVATFVGVIDGESITSLHYIGVAITLIGVYLVNKK
jgi:drug/metabolite transporter (DMT)-like permease